MTPTRAPLIFFCMCPEKPKEHVHAVQRILVSGVPDADPQLVGRALEDIRYDLTMMYGPEVVMVVTYQEGEGAGTVAAARAWAIENGIAEEPRGEEIVCADLTLINSADRPAAEERRPVGVRPTFYYDAA